MFRLQNSRVCYQTGGSACACAKCCQALKRGPWELRPSLELGKECGLCRGTASAGALVADGSRGRPGRGGSARNPWLPAEMPQLGEGVFHAGVVCNGGISRERRGKFGHVARVDDRLTARRDAAARHQGLQLSYQGQQWLASLRGCEGPGVPLQGPAPAAPPAAASRGSTEPRRRAAPRSKHNSRLRHKKHNQRNTTFNT